MWSFDDDANPVISEIPKPEIRPGDVITEMLADGTTRRYVVDHGSKPGTVVISPESRPPATAGTND